MPKLSISFLSLQSSEIEKAHYYLDAALTYMTYCVTKEVGFAEHNINNPENAAEGGGD